MGRLTAQRAANRRQASTSVAQKHARRGSSDQASMAISQSLKPVRCQATIQRDSDGSYLGSLRSMAVLNGHRWAAHWAATGTSWATDGQRREVGLDAADLSSCLPCRTAVNPGSALRGMGWDHAMGSCWGWSVQQGCEGPSGACARSPTLRGHASKVRCVRRTGRRVSVRPTWCTARAAGQRDALCLMLCRYRRAVSDTRARARF